MNNPFENAKQVVRSVAKLTPFSESFITQILEPQRIIEVNIPVKMDDGSTKIFTGYRSQHNNARGPYKGGICFHPQVTLDEVKALSVWMSIKTSTLGLPLGGGKGGIIIDPKLLSKRELEELSRGYVKATWRNI